MASHLSVSLSESMQASLILKHQEERRQHAHHNHHQLPLLKQATRRSYRNLHAAAGPLTKEGPETSIEVPLYQQCLLVMGFSGIEMCGTFTMIYSILFLGFIGVPTSLLSVEGLIAGGVSIVYLPITGYFADKGTDLVIRKMKMSLISLIMFVLGFSGLSMCSAMRLDLTNTPSHNNTPVHSINTISTPHHDLHADTDTTVGKYSGRALLYHYFYQNHSLGSTMQDNDSTSSDTILCAVGILSTAFVDMGFCTGITMCRAFILEASPPDIHNKLLIMATIFSSFGGLVLSIIGTIDFQTMLRSSFNVDGTAATVLVLSCGILTCVIVSFACTLVTGYLIHRRTQRCSNESDLRRVIKNNETSFKRQLLLGSSSISYSIAGVDEGDDTDPLLISLAFDNRSRSYSSLSVTSLGDLEQRPHHFYKGDALDVLPYQKILSPWEHSPSNVIHEGKVFETNTEASRTNVSDDDKSIDNDEEADNEKDEDENADMHEDEDLQFSGSSSEHATSDESGNEDKDDDDDGDDDNDNMSYDENNTDQEGVSEMSNLYAAMRASNSMSLSAVYSSILGNNEQVRNSGGRLLSREQLVPSDGHKSIWQIKRLKFLLLAIFFTMGSMAVFGTYSGNTLTIGVFHGVPSAAAGSRERGQYNEGVRASALGNLILYSAFSVVCLMNKKIIDVVGERAYFVASQLSFMAVIVTFITTKSKEVYFAASTVCGFYRGCAFTLGYIMVTKLVREETSKPEKNIGQVMAVIGFLLPSKIVLLSIMTGPLMAVFHSVWVPMVIGVVDSGLALVAFCLFLVVKG